MLKTFYKLQRRSWLKSWGVSNYQNEKLHLGEGIHSLENNCLPYIPTNTKKRGEGSSSDYDGSKTSYDNTHQSNDGIWFGNCQLHFLEAVGLGTAVVAGIRFTVENEKYKRVKPVSSLPHGCCSLLLDQIHNVANILRAKHDIVPACSRSIDFCVLPDVTVWNKEIKRVNSEPQSSYALRPFDTCDENKIISNDEEHSIPSKEDLSSYSQPINNANQNEKKQNRFFTFQAFVGVSTFFPSFAPPHFLPLFEPLAVPLDLSSSASSSSYNLSTDFSHQKSSSYQNDLHNLMTYLKDVKDDFLVEEKCKIAAKMAKKGFYKKSTEIWSEIVKGHPHHVKSLYNLAVCYENGLSFEQDLEKAKELYQRAADMNHPMSWYRLARIYLRESNSSANNRQVCLDHYRHYLNKAATSKVTRAERDYGILLFKEKNFGESLTFLERAASKKDLKAQSYLPLCKKSAFRTIERVINQSILPSFKGKSNTEPDMGCSDCDTSNASSSCWDIKLCGFDMLRASSQPKQKTGIMVSQAHFSQAGTTLMV